jgi:HD-like signal output (HDOD) protein
MAASITQTVMAELTDSQAASLKILLDRGIKIPPQPRVAEQFRAMVERGERDLRRLAQVLAEDPGITGMLFKVVRTPAYAQYQPFESIEDILQAVGLKQSANLVMAIAFGVCFPKKNAATLEAYWARSRAIAQLAMLVAEFRFSDPGAGADQAYLAGIMHDAGVPAMMLRFTNYCDSMDLASPGKWANIAEEDKKFFADHAVVGYLIGKHWHLPAYVCAAIRFHHDLESTVPTEAQGMVAVVQYATELYYRDRRVENPDWAKQRAGVYEALNFISQEDEQQCSDSIFVAYDALG